MFTCSECRMSFGIGSFASSVARREHHFRLAGVDVESLSVGEQAVPLRSVGRESVRVILELLPQLLDVNDLLSDGGGNARFALR